MPLIHHQVALPALTFDYDVQAARWTWAHGLRELHGLRASEEPTTDRLLEHMHKDDRVVMISRFQHHLENAGPYSCSYRMRDADGQQRRLIFVGQSEAEGGVIRRLHGFVVDITEPARQFGREAVATSARQHSCVEKAKGALMLAFTVDDDGATDLLTAYARRQDVSVTAVARVIVDRLASPSAEGIDPRARMAQIVTELAGDS